jgi:hypothetical protein
MIIVTYSHFPYSLSLFWYLGWPWHWIDIW